MVKFKTTGTIVEVGEVKTFGSGFQKLEFIVDVSDNPTYPSPVPFNLKKDRCTMIKGFATGDRVELEFTLDGRKWDSPTGTRYFSDITCWKLEKVGGAPATAEQPEAIDPSDTDLPF